MTATLTAHDMPLSKALKTSTAAAHEKAEHSSFMQDLMEGRLDMNAFRALQEQSWLVYKALENAAHAVATDPVAAPIVDPLLDRVPSLENDLDNLHGNTTWRETVTALPATAEYVARLDKIAADKDAAALVGHHYVRYLGDLSGGQVIARMMQRHYGAADEVLSFYHFDGIAKLKPYKDGYRANLDALEVTDAQRATLLDEASEAFLLNFKLFGALGA